MIDDKPVHPKLSVLIYVLPYEAYFRRREFFISISGFVASDPLLEHIMSRTSPKLATPSLHVVGDTDVIVIPERSQLLINICCENTAKVERHEGGS